MFAYLFSLKFLYYFFACIDPLVTLYYPDKVYDLHL